MERLMHFVWQHRLGLRQGLKTVDGRRVIVVDQGVYNTDAGPDFFNATIEIGNETWVGNVEIHVRASDWYRHGHDRDRAYDSVVLHVVQYDDMAVKRSDGSVIPQIVMHCTPGGAKRCNALLDCAINSLPCEATIKHLPHIYLTDWLTALGAERMYRKSERIQQLVADTQGYWEGAAYVTFARALGFGLNGDPFELLARSLPLKFLNRHHDELLTTEALVFGQAGLIPAERKDEHLYTTRLRQEYAFMQRKFSLQPPPLAWKMARTRPQNLPYRRLAALAQMVHKGFYMVGQLSDATTLDDMRRVFDVTLISFWANHLTFESAGGASKAMSAASIDKLLINVAIPLLHARAMSCGDLDGMERCMELLQTMKGEDNAIIHLFAGAGLKCDDAFTSQALIELRREYCEKKKCIYCRFGHKMLSAELQNSL